MVKKEMKIGAMTRSEAECTLRAALDRLQRSEPNEYQPASVEELRAEIDACEKDYIRTESPELVWHATMLCYILARQLNQPMELPTWVQAYLVEAAFSIGGLVENMMIDRSLSQIEDQSKPVRPRYRKAGQLNDAVLKALRFKQGQGRTPLIAGYRYRRIRSRVKNIEYLRVVEGVTLEEAIRRLGAEEYLGEFGPRQYLKDRSRVYGKTSP